MTFDQCSAAYIAAHQAGWHNFKHRQQWTHTLRDYASPIFGALPVEAIDTALVMRVLEPIWATKSSTASRVRGRIESILDWAKVRGYREGENPARWKGHLDHLLPARGKVKKALHHAALPYTEVPAFMARLRGEEGVAAKALSFLILTAVRRGEVLGARWGEIDLAAKVWTIPAKRMKAGREHRVPLSSEALAILQSMPPINDVVFPVSGEAMWKTLRSIEIDATAHGFRSSFRDWCGEETSFPREVAEAALAHLSGDSTERAYRRLDALEKRRELMEAWAGFCCDFGEADGKVLRLRR